MEPLSSYARAVGRFVAALACLEGTWLVACERMREALPLGLAIFLAGPWLLLAGAFRATLPPGRRTTAALVAALLALDVLADLWVPYAAPRYALVGWQLARLAAVVSGARLAEAWLGRAPAGQQTARLARTAGWAALGVLLASAGYNLYRGTRDEARRADAALVLGFALDPSGRARPELVSRVDRAAELYRRGLVPRIVMSGGAAVAGRTEAEVMRELAQARGVRAADVVLEARSRTTIENFAFAAPILRALGARTVLLVTEPYHLPRSLVLARRYGVDARGVPAVSATWRAPRWASYLVFREALPTLAERVYNALGAR